MVVFKTGGILKDDIFIKFINTSFKNPGLFFPGEMGFLYYIILSQENNNNLKVKRFNYQKIIADYNLSEQIKLFSDSNNNKFIHYAGPTKPNNQNLGKYHIQPYIEYILEFMSFTKKSFNDKALFQLAQNRGEYLNSIGILKKQARTLIKRLLRKIRN
jgi:hypothetical protein